MLSIETIEVKRMGVLAKATVTRQPRNQDKSKTNKVAHFPAVWGNGRAKIKNGESRESFEYKAGEAAIKEIKQYGDLCRTRGGDLYFTSKELPWNVIPLLADDPRLVALIDHVFKIKHSSTQAFKLILSSMQNEAFVRGNLIDVLPCRSRK